MPISSSSDGGAAAQAKARLAKPVRFGKHKLLLELGRGGMANVYLAVYSGQAAEGFNKLTVLKRLRSNLAEDPEFVTMLLDEARLAARLNHPNIVQTNEIGKVNDQYFIAMEYLDGQPLHLAMSRAMKAGERIPLNYGATILCEVLAGLHYAHELPDFDGSPLKIVHRDVSPHNIFVTYAGQVKVVDFGIAKAANRSAETREGLVKGKIAYMAPEQPTGTLDGRADVFAVGIILWEIAVGERMWKRLDDLAIFHRLVGGNIPRSPREANASVPEEIDRICRKALAPDPAERYASAAEMQNDLESYLRSGNAYASGRELGEWLGRMFADKREQARKVIEAQLAVVRSSAQLEEVVGDEEISLMQPVPSGGPAQQAASFGVKSETILAPFARSTTRSRPRPLMTLLAGAALIAAVLAVVVALRRSTRPAPLTNAPSSSQALPAAQPGEIHVILRATPQETQFSIDDGPPLDNPFLSTVARDGSSHLVTARAPGFKTRTVEVTYAGDVVLELSLVADPNATGGGRAAPQPNTGAHRGAAPAQASGKDEGKPHRPVRPIDLGSPW